MIQTPIISLDVHGLRAEEAQRMIDGAIADAGKGVYRIRVIHGFNRGTGIKSMILEEYQYGRCDQVLRVVPGDNQGITELVLREY